MCVCIYIVTKLDFCGLTGILKPEPNLKNEIVVRCLYYTVERLRNLENVLFFTKIVLHERIINNHGCNKQITALALVVLSTKFGHIADHGFYFFYTIINRNTGLSIRFTVFEDIRRINTAQQSNLFLDLVLVVYFIILIRSSLARNRQIVRIFS